MLRIELNSAEFIIYTALDLVTIGIPDRERYFREIHPGFFISSGITTDKVLATLGFRMGSYDWALPQEWARLHATRSIDPYGEVYYANPRAIWCYQKDKGCDSIFGSPIWLADVEKEFGELIVEKIKEQME